MIRTLPPTQGTGQVEYRGPGPRVLRLSLTDRCDLRCRYCLPAGPVPFAPPAGLASDAELLRAVAWLVEHAGVDRLKLTGGEPLLHRGVVAFTRRAAALPGLREVSMTTNGTRLARHAAALRSAGLARVNVSLDTLDPQRFAALTRGGDVRRVLAGIAAARDAGLAPVKLNAVLRRSGWHDDVPALLDFAAGEGLEIRFIELMRTGTERAWAEAEFVPADEVRALLEREGRLQPLPTPPAAPARRTLAHWRGQPVALGWITPVSHAFCGACDRLRMDAAGRLHRCLMDPSSLALVGLLRADGPEAALAEVDRYMTAKLPPAAMNTSAPMRGIGG